MNERLVEELRAVEGTTEQYGLADLIDEAADEIEQLRRDVEWMTFEPARFQPRWEEVRAARLAAEGSD